MTYRTNIESAPPASALSQAVFVIIGLTVIVAGLWTLYMGDAPYHPEGGALHGDVILASD